MQKDTLFIIMNKIKYSNYKTTRIKLLSTPTNILIYVIQSNCFNHSKLLCTEKIVQCFSKILYKNNYHLFKNIEF